MKEINDAMKSYLYSLWDLRKRLEHTNCKHAVVGISGGLDSTLAVLVTARAFDLLDIPRENLICVTMPCFGTTDRTYQNAVSLIKRIRSDTQRSKNRKKQSASILQISDMMKITMNVTYENSQAREKNPDSDGHGKPVQWYGHRNRRYVRTGTRMGNIQRGSYVYVCSKLLRTKDISSLPCTLLCRDNRE